MQVDTWYGCQQELLVNVDQGILETKYWQTIIETPKFGLDGFTLHKGNSISNEHLYVNIFEKTTLLGKDFPKYIYANPAISKCRINAKKA